ncbi:MAG: pyridoxal phosphate-dependent aminotransferase [Eubacteriaceae bacterium]|nr:pyridoxal phosphate-dependent aminotransferase [Eubacteriaceae bacterium]
MQLSNRIKEIEPSPIRKFNKIASEIEKQGKKIYRLNIGQPDIKTPECFIDAIKNYDKKVIAYAESNGTEKLLDSICGYYGKFNVSVDPSQIIITNGGSEALSMAFTCILNKDDEVIMAEPFYTNYRTFVRAAAGRIVPINTKAEDGYSYATREKLEAAVTDKTRAVVCITPGNPTGNILSLDDMKIVGEFAKEHDLWIIADEVYREFCYDGRKEASFGQLEEYADRVIIADSASKRYSACGARIGSLISKNKELIAAAIKLAQGRLSCPTLDQVGSAELYKLPNSYYEGVREEYEERRNVFYEEIMKTPGVICQKPGGAFYMTIKLPVDDAEKFLEFMLTEFEDKNETVMFTPAAGFYATPGCGKNEIRIAYVLKKDKVRRSAQLLRLGLEAFKKKGNR